MKKTKDFCDMCGVELIPGANGVSQERKRFYKASICEGYDINDVDRRATVDFDICEKCFSDIFDKRGKARSKIEAQKSDWESAREQVSKPL